MKILFLSTSGDGLGMANRLASESNTVSFFSTKDLDQAGDGLVDKVSSWRPLVGKSDLIVCDNQIFANYEDTLRRNGKPVIGTSLLGNFMQGVKREDFLKRCGLTMCTNNEQIVTIHGWFNGRDWVKPFYMSQIENYLFPQNLGPIVECMGCTVKSLIERPLFADEIGEGLRKLGMKDFITVSYGINSDGSVGCRGVFPGFVYDVIETVAEGIRENLSDTLFEISTGIAKRFSLSTDYLLGVRMTVPPYPYDSITGTLGKVEGIDENNLNHIYLSDVVKNDSGYYLTGNRGLVLKCTARGRSIKEAQRRVYRTLGNIKAPYKQYRIDIGNTAQEFFNFWEKKGITNGKY